jgi:hypothetical protein
MASTYLPAGVIKKVDRLSIAGKRAWPVRPDLPRATGAPETILPHSGRCGTAGSFIGAAYAPTGFWGHGCGLVFNPEPNKGAGKLLGARLGAPMERCSYIELSEKKTWFFPHTLQRTYNKITTVLCPQLTVVFVRHQQLASLQNKQD